MAENELTTIQIEKDDLKLLRDLAKNDLRSNPMELRWLIEAELARREQYGVIAMQELPHPEGCETIPLVLIGVTK